ncbi:CBS domain-containing protein [Thiocystis violascens]|uniref:CBS-domain-containing membrane protein n=1 Tax=Thiocystis violascens (strain ATCC 17096 / DSM 198 / 6111) TaxID=765911 RepID=I3Y9M8_THIV6|nr:CBS domain-containing protein [Thiocystis violascens]AFL73696.1 CBS-domain-containing membrane protein [Thiocystis violascens DSM 198]
MTESSSADPLAPTSSQDDLAEIEITDDDILEAMREIPGYLDITTMDFRAVYHLAHRHAIDRLFGGITAGRLMRDQVSPLTPDIPLAEAIPSFVRQGLKSLPVVDGQRRVIGILTETDVLRALGAETFLALLARVIADAGCIQSEQHHRPVGDLMTAPAVSVPLDAGPRELVAAFASHPGRAMPVISADGRLAGLLLRKVFLTACHLDREP